MRIGLVGAIGLGLLVSASADAQEAGVEISIKPVQEEVPTIMRWEIRPNEENDAVPFSSPWVALPIDVRGAAIYRFCLAPDQGSVTAEFRGERALEAQFAYANVTLGKGVWCGDVSGQNFAVKVTDCGFASGCEGRFVFLGVVPD